jgi:uncharacterized protein
MHSEIRNLAGERIDIAYHSAMKLGALVLLGHGVTGNKDRPLLVAVANGLAERGWPCLRISFTGNGDSEGEFEAATISKELEDLRVVLATIPQEKKVAYVGHSMGAAVGVKCAAKSLDLHALVSLAGMVHTADFAVREFGDVTPGEGFMWDEPDCPLSEGYMADMKEIGNVLPEVVEVRVPWLLIHGTEDDVVPLGDSRDAFAAAKCDKKLVELPGAGHSFGEGFYADIIEDIDAWLIKSLE